jgi:hypothetical protein
MSQALLPYADARQLFKAIEYRASSASPFESLNLDGDRIEKIVRVDDLRTIPEHQFRLEINFAALAPHYESAANQIELIVMCRDTVLRREIILGKFTIGALPTPIALDRRLLSTTGFRDELPIDFVAALSDISGRKRAWPTQRASRLASLRFTIRGHAAGPTFPFKRVTTKELAQKGLPAETAIYLELLSDATELIRTSDTDLSNLLEVWIHEKLWAALQNDRNLGSSTLRAVGVTAIAAAQMFNAAEPRLRMGDRIDEDSCIGRLLAFIERENKLEPGFLRKRAESEKTLGFMHPYTQAAWRFATNGSRLEEERVE